MKILGIALLSVGLLMSGALLANTFPAGNHYADVAACALLEGNGHIDVAYARRLKAINMSTSVERLGRDRFTSQIIDPFGFGEMEVAACASL